MRIICPTCASHYEIDEHAIGPQGQLARCAQCRDVWLVHRPDTGAMPVVGPSRGERRLGGPERPRASPATAPEPIDFSDAKARLRSRDNGLAFAPAWRSTLGMVLAGGLLVATSMGALAFRDSIVRRAPSAGALFAGLGLPVNPHGLALREFRSSLAMEGDKTVLTVQGRIANLRDEGTPVPNLTVAVRDAGQTPIYSWVAASPKIVLAKGESVPFRSRLASPPSAGQDVRVSFADAASR